MLKAPIYRRSPGKWLSVRGMAAKPYEINLHDTVIDDAGNVLAQVSSSGVLEWSPDEEANGNARIMAAAPDFLEALEDIAECTSLESAIDIALAAIIRR